MGAVQNVDSIILGGASGCDVKAASDGAYYPIHRDAGAVTLSAGAATSIAIATHSGILHFLILVVRVGTWHDMLSRLIQCPQQAPLRYLKQCCTILQLEVAVLQKQRKGHMKVLNVSTVVHVTEKLVYVVVTQATRANRVKHKQCWFNLPQVIN